MNARTTLLVFLAFAALAIFAWTVRDEAPRQVGPNAPTATPGPIWEVGDDGVTALSVISTTGSYTLTRIGDGWEVDGQPAASDVGATVQAAASPTVQRVLGEDRDPNDYGFASPALTLTFTISDVQRILLVGDKVPTSSDYYVRPAEGGPMRIVSGFDIDRLKEWLTAPPLAPTATPEASATPAEGTAEATPDGTPAADDGTPGAEAEGDGAADGTAEPTAEAGDEPTEEPEPTTAASATPVPTPTATPSDG